MKCLQFAALMLCWLIVSLPITFAQEINIVKFGGGEGAEGFAAKEDDVLIEVNPVIPGDDDIDKSQVQILRDENLSVFSADLCEKKDGKNICGFTEVFDSTENKKTYAVKLLDDSNQEIYSIQKDIVLDDAEPIVRSFSSASTKTKENQIELTYVVEDPVSKETNVCSGIKEVGFIIEDKVISTEKGKLGECKKEGTVIYDHQSISSFEELRICTEAYDFVGQASGRKCLAIVVDNQPPFMSNFKLLDSQGISLSHVKQGIPVSVDVSVDIVDDGLIEATVLGDFTKMDPSSVQRKHDRRKGDAFVWRKILLTSPSCEVKISANDALGNVGENTFYCTLKTDMRKPKVLSIATRTTTEDGIPLLGYGEKIIVELDDLDDAGEIGTGFDKKNIFLDLTSFGFGKKQPDECKQSGSKWTCSWKIIPDIGSGKKTVAVTPDTRDDLENTVESPMQKIIEYDNIPPQIQGEIELRIFHTNEIFQNLTLAGDNLEFIIKASDVFEAYANFTQIGGEYVKGTCEGNDVKSCIFSSAVGSSGPYTAEIKFDLFDKAGNKATAKHSVFVYGAKDEPNPNYWRIRQIKCTPRLIDRSIGTLMQQKVYCHAKLTPISSVLKPFPVSTVLNSPTECVPFDSLKSYIADIKLLNGVYGSTDAYFELTLARNDFVINDLNVTCPLSIVTKTSNFTITNPEIENASIKLQFYNLPLGELNKNIERNVQKEIDKAEKLFGWVGTLQKIMDYLTKICQIKTVITTVLMALETVYGVIKLVATVLVAVPPTTAAGEALDNTGTNLCDKPFKTLSDLYENQLFTFLNGLCNWANCAFTKKDSEKWSIFGEAGEAGGEGGEATGGSGGLFEATEKLCKSMTSGISAVQIKESLIWSIVCFCIPGIIYNLNKLRQVHCRTSLCYMEDVLDKGVPISHCADIKSYFMCNFIVGQIFSALPFTSFIDQFSNMAKDMVANPFAGATALVMMIAGKICNNLCSLTYVSSLVQVLCQVPKLLKKVGDAYGSVNSIENPDFWKTNNNYCDASEKATERRKRRK